MSTRLTISVEADDKSGVMSFKLGLKTTETTIVTLVTNDVSAIPRTVPKFKITSYGFPITICRYSSIFLPGRKTDGSTVSTINCDHSSLI